MDIEKINILGVKINKLTFSQTISKIGEYLNSQKQHYIVTPNPEIILAAQKDEELKNILNNADLNLPDGAGLIPASKFRIKNRITGSDVMLKILKIALNKNHTILFILNHNGLTDKETLKNILSKKYPKLHHLIIYENEKLDIEVNPDVIFIGLGCPRQEKWIKKNKYNYPNSKLFMTVGGGIDFLCGTQKRAPAIFKKIGFEWLWRLIKHPKRIKRIFKAVIVFPLKVFFNAK